MRFTFRGEKSLSTLLPTWQNNTPDYSPVSFENMVRSGWRRNELIFACIDKAAKTGSSIHLEITDSKGKPLPDHPLARLIANPNPYMTESDFWAAVVIFQKLAGNAYFEKERSRGGQVVRLWPLRPDWIAPIKSNQNFIGGYEYAVPGQSPITLAPNDVLDFRLFDPLNQYRGYPPTAVAARVGDVDNSVTDYLKIFFEKGGQPPGLLKTTQKLQDADVANIRRRWGERYGGYEHWTEPAVLDSDAEFQKIGLDFKEMGFDVLDARNEARICMVMDIPPILVGAKIGLDRATYSNYSEARRAWWQDSLIPMYVGFQDTIEAGLVPEFGDNLLAGWDFSSVPALQEEANGRWTRATAAWSANAITRNEFYKEIGKEQIGKEGDVYHSDTQTAVQPEPANAFTENAKQQFKALGDMPPDDATRRKFERQWQRLMTTYLRDSEKRIAAELESHTPAKAGLNGSS